MKVAAIISLFILTLLLSPTAISDDTKSLKCILDRDCPSGQQCYKQTCREPGKPGDSCILSRDCSSKLQCFNSICREPGVEGAECILNRDCASGQQCFESICRSAQGAGYGSEGNSCESDTDCINGQQCFENSCRGWGKRGDKCNSETDCVRGLQCFSEKCRPYGTVGDTCLSNTDCVLGTPCLRPKYTSGICGFCSETSPCKEGYACKGNMCIENEKAKTSCNSEKDCSNGYKCVCNKPFLLGCLSKTCSPGKEGDFCNKNEDCANELKCSNNACKKFKTEGENCKKSSECDNSMLCVCKQEFVFFCVKTGCSQGKQGDTCGRNEDCSSGYWCENRKCKEFKQGWCKYAPLPYIC